MQEYIQFETIVDNGVIRIPEQYIKKIPSTVKVALVPVDTPRIKIGNKSKFDSLSSNDFTALKINTEGWRFNCEEANERR